MKDQLCHLQNLVDHGRAAVRIVDGVPVGTLTELYYGPSVLYVSEDIEMTVYRMGTYESTILGFDLTELVEGALPEDDSYKLLEEARSNPPWRPARPGRHSDDHVVIVVVLRAARLLSFRRHGTARHRQRCIEPETLMKRLADYDVRAFCAVASTQHSDGKNVPALCPSPDQSTPRGRFPA